MTEISATSRYVKKREVPSELHRSFSGAAAASQTASARWRHYFEAAAGGAEKLISARSSSEAVGQIVTALAQLLGGLSADESQRLHSVALRLDLGLPVRLNELEQAALILSDIRRLSAAPWHSSVPRRVGILADFDGYPLSAPKVNDEHIFGRLIDELEYLRMRRQVYALQDHEGELHDVVGPASNADGTVDPRLIRALTSMSVARMNKMRELLPPAAQRSLSSHFGPGWPWPTRLAGFRNGKVEVAAFLRAENFGVAPELPDDLDEPTPPSSRGGDYPPLPPALPALLRRR